MIFSPIFSLLFCNLPLIGEIRLVTHENPCDELAAIGNRVVFVPVSDALLFGFFNPEGLTVSDIEYEKTNTLFPDMTKWQGVLSLQTSGVPNRYLDFSPSSNILDVSILNIVNCSLLRSSALIKGFLGDKCHHECCLTDPIVAEHDKVEDMIVVHLIIYNKLYSCIDFILCPQIK